MATKKKTAKSTATGKPVVIVESPAKAKTLGKFLGKDYTIEASVGHIRDLPASAAEIPPSLKKEPWSRLGIDIDDDFRPLYVVPKNKRDHMRKLKGLVKDAPIVYLATDEDREGESISWHLVEELKPKGEIKRLVFHEITKEAILQVARGAARHQRGPGRGAGNPAPGRPALRLHGVAAAVEEDPARSCRRVACRASRCD